MADIIQIRRDTAANWTSADPILADGEWGYETDTTKIKVGDGVTAWTSLAYWSSTGAVAWGAITGTLSDQTDLQSALDTKLEDITAEPLGDLSDVTITAVADNELLAYDSGGDWINQTAAELGLVQTGHTHLEADITDLGNYGEIDQDEAVTGLWNFQASGLGGFTDYDLTVGDVVTPDYGMIRIGEATFGRTSRVTGNLDLDGTVVLINRDTPPTSNILFAMMDGSNSMRFALPKSAVGNGTYNPRSMIIAGPAPNDDTAVTVGYWQSQGIFHNLVMDTSGDGADLGVQNDLEVEGDIFVDTLKESTTGAGINVAVGTLKQGGTAVSLVGHTHLEADITDLDHDAVKLQGDDIYASIAPSDGQVLTWDNDNSRWDAATPSGGGSGLTPSISDLSGSGDIFEVTVDTNSVGFGAALTMGADGNFDMTDATGIVITEVGNAHDGASSGTTASVTHGLTILENDVIIATVHLNGAGETISDDNGSYAFTESHQWENPAGSQLAIYHRVAGASEPATYSFSLSDSDDWSLIIRVFRNVDSSVWDVAPAAARRANDSTGTIATAPSMTTTTDHALGLLICFCDSSGITWASSDYSNLVQQGNRSQGSFTKIWNEAGATGTASATLSGDNDWVIFQVALKPAGGANMPCRALALETGTGSKDVLLRGFIRDDSWDWTPGSDIWVSTTEGEITDVAPTASGDHVQRIGFAWSADIIFFDPSDWTEVVIA